MPGDAQSWDYLIVTAANEQQAAAYESQLGLRRETGALRQARTTLVVADADGRRAGSGGSTAQCLNKVLRRESAAADPSALFRRLRILIVHGGGDSRRLPAYSPCGKIFVPLPGGDEASRLPPTLFDRLVPVFLGLPGDPRRGGQVVIASGDALLLFDSSEASFSWPGITSLGATSSPAEASRHGVLCPGGDGLVRRFLQKPALEEQRRWSAFGEDGRPLLDIGVMSMDGGAAATMLEALGTAPARAAISAHGIDLYREICCALGTDATFDGYLAAVRSSGSRVDEAALASLFERLRSVRFNVSALSRCRFLHFGSTGQLITSGIELSAHDCGAPPGNSLLSVSNAIEAAGRIEGAQSWAEGCRIRAPLMLTGHNVIVGVDVDEPFTLPEQACLDIAPGVDRSGRGAWFVRYYHTEDTFKQSVAEGATFCGVPLAEWLRHAGLDSPDVWDAYVDEREGTLWNARVFPSAGRPSAYPEWRWMLDIRSATAKQKEMLRATDRYSSAEIALRIDHDAFHRRRAEIRASQLK